MTQLTKSKRTQEELLAFLDDPKTLDAAAKGMVEKKAKLMDKSERSDV